MRLALARIRTLVYYSCWFLPYTLLWCGFSSATFWLLPSGWRYRWVVTAWCVPLIWGAKWILGIRYRVLGAEHVPDSAIILCNHQSTWEAMFMLALFEPQVPILKQSLVRLPFFGWAVRSVNGVAIDRGNPMAAARKMLVEGKAHLEDGVPYLVFYPEGTRRPPGALGKFSRSGAVLAHRSGLPLVPISQNSGYFWRHGSLAHLPGEITVEIHPPIDVGQQGVNQAMHQARTTIWQGLERADPPANADAGTSWAPSTSSGSAS